MTDDDFRRLENKIDMVLHHFNIGKEGRRTDREIKEYVSGKLLKFEERRRKREGKNVTSEHSQKERESH